MKSRRLMAGRLDCWLWFIFIWCLVVMVIFLWYGEDQSRSPTLQQLDKCPLCFGDSSCFMLHPSNKHALRMVGTSRFSLMNYVNVKNVYVGVYKQQQVVLKKLAHDSELAAFDSNVCSLSRLCLSPVAAFRRYLREHVFPDFKAGRSTSLQLTADIGERLQRDHLTCASPRFLHFLYDAMEDTSEHKFFHFSTALLINAEPLFLQAFPQSHGWPFPRYIGACGRVVVEQHVGTTLTHFRDAPWRQRVELALQLLELAELLTFNDHEFNLYMTDVSADNFAVDSDGRLFLVDVEDLVVVDRRQVARAAPRDWNITYAVPVLRPDGMGFEPDQLCSHTVADHNYFAMCKGLLSPDAFGRGMRGGLLHTPPELVTSALPELADWLSRCSDPGQVGRSRLEPAEQLRRMLNLALSEQGMD